MGPQLILETFHGGSFLTSDILKPTLVTLGPQWPCDNPAVTLLETMVGVKGLGQGRHLLDEEAS